MASLSIEVGGNVVVARRRVRMVLSEHPGAYLQSLSVKRLGLGMASLGIKVVGNVVIARRRAWMVFSEHPGAYLKSLSVKRFGLGMASLVIKVGGDVVVARRRVWMAPTQIVLKKDRCTPPDYLARAGLGCKPERLDHPGKPGYKILRAKLLAQGRCFKQGKVMGLVDLFWRWRCCARFIMRQQLRCGFPAEFLIKT